MNNLLIKREKEADTEDEAVLTNCTSLINVDTPLETTDFKRNIALSNVALAETETISDKENSRILSSTAVTDETTLNSLLIKREKLAVAEDTTLKLLLINLIMEAATKAKALNV